MNFPVFWAFLVVSTFAIASSDLVTVVADETPAASWMTGERLHQELNRTLTASWTREESRKIIRKLSALHGVPIVLDRRLDPSTELKVDLSNVTLLAGLEQIAGQISGNISLPYNLVYIGPESTAKRLRTLIELRVADLVSNDSPVSTRRRKELQQRTTFEWNDLDTPREILERIIGKFDLKILNLELIPHDLWAAATLPDVSLAEALSVILAQFDLTYNWKDSQTIELVSIPESVSIEKKFHPKMKLADAVSRIQAHDPGIQVHISKSDLVVKGAIEDYETVVSLLNGTQSSSTIKNNRPQLIRDRSFTFQAPQPVSLISLMQKLEESKIRFDYNSDELKAAGIDLRQMIQFEVKDATADQFFAQVFGSVGLDFQIDQLTVKLKPKRSAKKQTN